MVLEQEQVRAEIEQLRARRAELDRELDRLLGQPASPKTATAAPKVSAPAAKQEKAPPPAKGKKAPRRRRGKGSKKVAPARKPAKAKRQAKPAPAPKGAKAGPTIKVKILAALRDKPEGVELGAVAKQAYGRDDKDARRKCEQNLYNMATQKLVKHDGPNWQLAAAAA